MAEREELILKVEQFCSLNNCDNCPLSKPVSEYSNKRCIETEWSKLPTKFVRELIDKMDFPEEEINHPSRYSGNKFECIDVMLDRFGADATVHFCKLNAFKYIWRESDKGGTQDIKKAIWYLNKMIEIYEGGSGNGQ